MTHDPKTPTPVTVETVIASARSELLDSLRQATRIRPVQADAITANEDRFAPLAERTHPLNRHWIFTLPTVGDAHRAPAPGATARSNPDLVARQLDEHADAPATEQWDADVPFSGSLLDLLQVRRSVIVEGPTRPGLGHRLMRVMSHQRERRDDSAGRTWQSRLHPSAGGTHCIEPLLYLHSSAEPWNRLNLTDGTLEPVRFKQPDLLVRSVLDATHRHEPPPVVLFAIADPDLLGSRYPGGSSLLWRDAGSFLTVAHLVAASYGTSSTIVGICVELAGLENRTPPFAVGAVALGAPTDDPTATTSSTAEPTTRVV